MTNGIKEFLLVRSNCGDVQGEEGAPPAVSSWSIAPPPKSKPVNDNQHRNVARA